MSLPFTPSNWRRLAELRDEMGDERLGASLASGLIRAFYIDASGKRQWMAPTDWLRPTAAEVMGRGQAFVRHAVPRGFGGGTIRHEEAWDLYIEGSAPEALHPSDPQRRRAATPRDTDALRQEAELRASAAEGPMTLVETVAWAQFRGLAREWAREQRRSWPDRLKLSRGNRRSQ